MTEFEKEAFRLTASALNSVAAGFIVTSVAVPIAAYVYKSSAYVFSFEAVVGSVILTLFGVFLHAMAVYLIDLVNR